MIDLDGEIVVPSRLLSQSRIKDISIDQKSGRRPSLGRTKERENCFGHRADPIGRNNVVREGCAISNRSRSRVESASQRIIDFDFGYVGGEVSARQRRCRHPNVIGIKTRTRVADAFIRKQEEGLVLAVVEFRNYDRTADAESGTVREGKGPRLASRISKEVICCPAARLDPVISRTMKLVSPRLDRDAGDAAFGVAKLSVIGCRLHLEFLRNVSGRNV